MTGGIGRAKLSHFYQHNFIFNNSADTELELISRTMGIDRIVDEFIFKFTHDQEIDWMYVALHVSQEPLFLLYALSTHCIIFTVYLESLLRTRRWRFPSRPW